MKRFLSAVLFATIIFIVGQNNLAKAQDVYVGVYPESGLKAYLITETISRYRYGFNCTVVCYPSGSPYYIKYTFNQDYSGFNFKNSDGYGGQVHSYNTPVEYNIWRYVW